MILTVTVVGATVGGFVTVLPTATDPGGQPTTSTLNVNANVARANQTVDAVAIGSAQTVNVYASTSTHVILDVVGYVTGSTTQADVVGLFRAFGVPTRVLNATIGAGGGWATGQVAGTAGIDGDALAVAAVVSYQNQTTTNAFATLAPSPAPGGLAPSASTLNAANGETVAGFGTSGLTAGTAAVYGSQAGVINVDVVGFYIRTMVPILPTITGEPSAYSWDPLGRLASVTAADGTVSSYSYLADGTRISSRTGSDSTYYLGTIEATRNAGAWTRVRRSYSYGGVMVASRTIDGSGNTLSWLLGNHQGSVTTTVTAGTATTRYYQPYGASRGPAPATKPTTTGFLGQHEDPTTLTYLNNRYYDPATGVFLSVDPLVGKTGEPYLYGSDNPVTQSDPSGLDPDTDARIRDEVRYQTKLNMLVHALVQRDIAWKLGPLGRAECKDLGGSIDVCYGTADEASLYRQRWTIAEVKKAGYSNLKDGRSYLRKRLREFKGRAQTASPGMRTYDGLSAWTSAGSFEVGVVNLHVDYWYADLGRSRTGGVYQYSYTTSEDTRDHIDEAWELLVGDGAFQDGGAFWIPTASTTSLEAGSLGVSAANTHLSAAAEAQLAVVVDSGLSAYAEEGIAQLGAMLAALQLEPR